MGFPLVLSRCDASPLELHLLADGELADDDTVADVRGHIAGCADCRAAWNGLTTTRQLLNAARPFQVMPAELKAALAAITDAP